MTLFLLPALPLRLPRGLSGHACRIADAGCAAVAPTQK
jgi:hypothetical protein